MFTTEMEDPSLKSSDSATPVDAEPGALIEFVCNICNQQNRVPLQKFDREVGSCAGCDSTVRTRAVVQMISRELFGLDIALPDFPVLKGLRGIGMSDSPDYAGRLAEKFSYTNTYFHKEPVLDIGNVPESETGSYDFLISSEVFEHVTPPVETAFQNAFRLLKPHGLFFFTVPYTLEARSQEHFPELHDYGIAQLSDRWVMVNRTRDGRLQVFEDLVFHGGPGETLEIRRFNETELRAQFQKAGFRDLEIHGRNHLPFGILRTENWSLPMTARKDPFVLNQGCATELVEQSIGRTKHLQAEVRTLRARIAEHDEWVAWATRKMSEDDQQVVDRTRWALDLESQLKQRTEWAMSLEKDVAHHVELAKRFQTESEERTKWAVKLQAEIEALRNSLARIKRSPWTKAGRLLRVVKE